VELPHLSGILDQREEAARYCRTTRGIVPVACQCDVIRICLEIADRLAVEHRIDDHRSDIVARLASTVGGHILEILDKVERRLDKISRLPPPK
jgi:hypothetical protein